MSGFVPNQGLDNDEMPTEYDLFAAVCHEESRNKTSGHFTAQCKIKGSNIYWIEYGDADFELNNLIIVEIEQEQRSSTILWHTFCFI